MSRFHWALCAFLVTTTPAVAIASYSPQLRRPDALRHAINPLVGDESFIERYGAPPSPATDPNLRVRTHLSFVHSLLSTRDTLSMPAELRDARRQNIARLHEYIENGVFPRNERYRDQNRPCFIDGDGRICAVGYLVEQSAGRDVAERINAKFQYAFVSEMKSVEVDEWIAKSGLSRLELSLIQPGYPPQFEVTVTQTGPTTVKLSGAITGYGCCCMIKFVSIDFGDAIWTDTYHTYLFHVPVSVEHTYAQPGAFPIVAKAVFQDWCGNDVYTKTWLVTLGAPVLKLLAVQAGGGPPYGVYLRTLDDINLQCLTSSMVRWSDGAMPQPTTWYYENGVYRTPEHLYKTTGTRTITISNSYMDDCAMNQSGSVTVFVNGLGPPGRSEQVSSWGRIKAMYR